MPRPDKHSEIEFNLLKAGSITYLLGGYRITIEAERLVAFWAAIPHQIVAFEGETPYFVATLPLSEFLETGLPLGVVNRILQGELVIDPAIDPCDALKFQQWEKELRKSDPSYEHTIRLEIQARLLRLARAISNSPKTTHPDPTLSRADQLACYIARNYQ